MLLYVACEASKRLPSVLERLARLTSRLLDVI